MFLLLVITCFCSFQAVHSNSTELTPISRCYPFTNCDEHYAVASFAKVNWFQANHICNSAGWALATVNNWQQHLEIMRSIANTANILGEKRFWLGATNVAERRSWTWFSTGLPITYRLWGKLEPRSDKTRRIGCMVFGIDERWHGADCKKEFYFICENICSVYQNRDKGQIYI